jgi:hypothetical protein
MSKEAAKPWEWPEPEWRRIVGNARAGRSLRPNSWPGGARCCVTLSFDADHETIPLRDADASPMRLSQGQYGNRQGVLLTVTHRHNLRDTVTISAGYSFPRNAEATVTVGGTDLNFYTAGTTAAARDGAAAVRAFRGGREAVMKAPGANGRGTVTDTFLLAGFGAAYEAISKECPPAGARR